jgi:hypothetical protein
MDLRRLTVGPLRWLAAGAACLALGWFAFVKGHNVPLLSFVDLGFHELGHLVASVLPTTVMFLAGTATQIAVPLGLAVYFWWIRSDRLAAALMLAWAGTSAQNASVYIADAPYQRLPLIGGQHDWAWLLGPRGFDVMDKSDAVSGTVLALGAAALLGGLIICAWGVWTELRDPELRRPIRVPGSGRLKVRPVRQTPWPPE